MIRFNLFALLMYLVGVSCNLGVRASHFPCKYDDVKCVTEMIQFIYTSTISGVPELGIETSDPMHQKLIEGKLPYVNYNLRNSNVEGFKTCKVKEASVNDDMNNIHLEMLCRRFHMDGDYDIDGKLLNIPIRGHGTYYVDATNYLITVEMKMGFYKKDGITHMVHKTFSFTADLLGEMDVELKNLFDGNKKLSDQLHGFARANSKVFASLLHDPVIGTNIKKFMKSFNQRLRSIPANELLQLNSGIKTVTN